MTVYPRQGIPLRPDPHAVRNAALTSFYRVCAAHLLAASGSELTYPGEVLARNWPHDRDANWLVTKASVSPATTTSMPVLLETALVDFLTMLGPMSAGSQLLARGISLSFQQNAALKVPSIVASAGGADFVEQGAPIPVRQLLLGGLTLEPRKFATISTFTGEIFQHSIPNIETVVRAVMTESVAISLDVALLGTTAGDAIRPPGLRNGIVALSPSVATTPTEAMIADVAALVGVVSAVAVNSPIVLIAAPARAVKLRLLAPRDLPLEVLASGAVGGDELIAVASNAVASAVDPVPRIDASDKTLLHHEDTTPLQFATGAQGSGVVATPSRSLWQTDVMGLRLVMEVSWGLRHPSGLAWIDGISAW